MEGGVISSIWARVIGGRDKTPVPRSWWISILCGLPVGALVSVLVRGTAAGAAIVPPKSLFFVLITPLATPFAYLAGPFFFPAVVAAQGMLSAAAGVRPSANANLFFLFFGGCWLGNALGQGVAAAVSGEAAALLMVIPGGALIVGMLRGFPNPNTPP